MNNYATSSTAGVGLSREDHLQVETENYHGGFTSMELPSTKAKKEEREKELKTKCPAISATSFNVKKQPLPHSPLLNALKIKENSWTVSPEAQQ